MSRIALISCVSKKLTHAAKAKDIYVSPLFQLCLQYAQSLRPDLIFVLSAKYGLVTLEQELEPYDDTLNTMRDEQIKSWAHAVLHQPPIWVAIISYFLQASGIADTSFHALGIFKFPCLV